VRIFYVFLSKGTCGYWGVQLTARPHRYGMAPPQGFAQWFDYAKRNNVKLLDEYDSILERIRPFASLPRDVLRQRSDMLQHDKTCVLLYARQGRASGADTILRSDSGCTT
jgi:hypothetical protein